MSIGSPRMWVTRSASHHLLHCCTTTEKLVTRGASDPHSKTSLDTPASPRYEPRPLPPRRVPPVADAAAGLVVETRHLTKIYQNRQFALNDVSVPVEPGHVLGLFGPNGAGKTTFLRLVHVGQVVARQDERLLRGQRLDEFEH